MKTLKIIEKNKNMVYYIFKYYDIGISFVIKDGLNYGIEFKGGTFSSNKHE